MSGSEPPPHVLADLDQMMAMARDQHPGKSEAWRMVLIRRLVHFKLHNGDMTDAPDLPDR